MTAQLSAGDEVAEILSPSQSSNSTGSLSRINGLAQQVLASIGKYDPVPKLELDLINAQEYIEKIEANLEDYQAKYDKLLEQLKNCEDPLHRPDQTEAGLSGEKEVKVASGGKISD